MAKSKKDANKVAKSSSRAPPPVASPAKKQRKRKLQPESESASLCQSLSDLQNQFKELWDDNANSLIPGQVNAEFVFRGNLFIVVDLSDENREAFGIPSAGPGRLSQQFIEVDVPAAVLPVSDTSIKRRRQRAVCKEIIKNIAAVDSYYYSEALAIDTAAGDGYRFKMVCVDSYDNKDRVANKRRKAQEKADELDIQLSDLPVDSGNSTRETYPCKGCINVRFSTVKNTIEIDYEHLPIHRAHIPVAPKKSKSNPQPIIEPPPLPMAQPMEKENFSPPQFVSPAIQQDIPMIGSPNVNAPSQVLGLSEQMRLLVQQSFAGTEATPKAEKKEKPSGKPRGRPKKDRTDESNDTSAPKLSSHKRAPGRGPSADPACSCCRSRKMKCDRTKPICMKCLNTKRHVDCSYP